MNRCDSAPAAAAAIKTQSRSPLQSPGESICRTTGTPNVRAPAPWCITAAPAASAPPRRILSARSIRRMRPPRFQDANDQTKSTAKMPIDIHILIMSSCGKAWTISSFMLWVTADHLRSGLKR